MYFESGISCSSAAFRLFSSRCSWITWVNTDGVSTAIDSSCFGTSFSLRRRSLDDRLDRRAADHAVATPAFRGIQGRIRRLDQLVDRRAAGACGHAEARSDLDGAGANRHHRTGRNQAASALSEVDAARDADADEDQGELLAAPTARDVALANRAGECVRKGTKDLVAGGVAEAIVDLLEVIEIGEHEAE